MLLHPGNRNVNVETKETKDSVLVRLISTQILHSVQFKLEVRFSFKNGRRLSSKTKFSKSIKVCKKLFLQYENTLTNQPLNFIVLFFIKS